MCSESQEEPGCSRSHVCSTGDLVQGRCPQEVAFEHGDPVPISGDHIRSQRGLDSAGSVGGPPAAPCPCSAGGMWGSPPRHRAFPSAGWGCLMDSRGAGVQVYDVFSK